MNTHQMADARLKTPDQTNMAPKERENETNKNKNNETGRLNTGEYSGKLGDNRYMTSLTQNDISSLIFSSISM